MRSREYHPSDKGSAEDTSEELQGTGNAITVPTLCRVDCVPNEPVGTLKEPQTATSSANCSMKPKCRELLVRLAICGSVCRHKVLQELR